MKQPFYETLLKARRAHIQVAYMDFFDQETNSSLAANAMANEAAEGDITYVPDYITDGAWY
jgi:hypothetical protein